MTQSNAANCATRYSRQTLFKPIGNAGQMLLTDARVAIVGVGALGAVLANHMVRSGVGYVRLIDRDFVELSNLQRQMLFDEHDANTSAPKAIAAAHKLRAINSMISIDPHVAALNQINAETLLSDVDLILDGSDNFSIRFLLNDVSVKHRIPWIYGGVISSRGVSMTIIPGETPCLRCMYSQLPEQGATESCETAGVISPAVHTVASHQATEALKLLVGDRQRLNRSMLQFDLWSNQRTEIDLTGARKENCPACAGGRYDYLDETVDEDTIQTLCGRNAVQVHPKRPLQLQLTDWADRFKLFGKVELNPFLLKFHIDDQLCLVLFEDGRALIQGLNDPNLAKSIYNRYLEV